MALATSIMAVNCGTPTPAITRVVQIDPGPIPTFTASAPALSSASVASPVAILPATSCMSGHSDLLAGVVTGSRELVDRVKSFMRVLGGILDPHAAYLLIRGMKSLGLRVARHNDNGVAVSRFLEGHEKVRAVHYPMLESHPQHELAMRQMRGGGGVVSFEVDGGLAQAKRLANALSIVRVAPSLGGVESLISIPCLTSHAMLSREQREKAGIRDGLIRLALGTEDAEDLVADLEEALGTL